MEQYRGVKFDYEKISASFPYDDRLDSLNRWAYLFSELGLTPVHPDGAYGNQSYRTGRSSFIITKSGMQPEQSLQLDNYAHVVGFKKKSTTFTIEGQAVPSSECFLHNALYEHLPEVNAILHGHCSLLNSHAKALGIPVTSIFHDYGTQELADSAIELVTASMNFFILKDHGFVAVASNIDEAGKTTLGYYAELIELLRKRIPA